MSSPEFVPVHDFRLLFESAPGLHLVLNPKLEIVAVSDAYLNATMTTRQEILGRGIFDAFPDNPNDPAATGVRNLKASLLRVLRDRVPDTMRVQKYDVRRPQEEGGGFEERYWSPVNSPVLGSDHGVQYIIHRVEDVTEFVRLQRLGQEQDKATEELRTRAEKMEAEIFVRDRQLHELNRSRLEAIGRLAGGIAHDFNNLLGVVLGNANLLLEKVPEESSLRKGLEHVSLAANRAADLTKQLLAYSRQQVIETKVLNLNSVLADLEPLIRRLIPENIEIRVVPGQNLDSVKADPGQVEQVIMNLMINARDAMPGGGKLIVETSNALIDESYQKQHPAASVAPGNYVMVSVADTGVGIDAETQLHIFEPFFTTKARGQGTGLGLATVYGIVKQNGGYVWVYSERNQGTTFKIYLPRTEEAVPEVLAQIRPGRVPGWETILVVEDQPMLRELIHKMLESSGYRVFSASTPSEGLDLAKSISGPIHAVLTDVIMPEMSGRALVERLARIRPEAKTLFMSGHSVDIVDEHGELIRGANFIGKPFTKDALCAKMSEILRGKTDNEQSANVDRSPN